MNRNPELIRNLWLEITAQRLLAVPVILALLVLIVFAGDTPYFILAWLGGAGFSLMTGFWGAKQAADAQSEEFIQGTWDAQRISGLSAQQMLLGKLFGGAAFAWYGGLWCLAVFLLGGLKTLPLADVLRALLGLPALALLMQALALLSTLLGWRKLRQVSPRQARGVGMVMAFILLSNLATLFLHNAASDGVVSWFDLELPRKDFLLLSLLAFTGWALLGAHRAMRAELQFRNRPWSWIAFVIFLQLYCAGFVGELNFAVLGSTAELSRSSLRLCFAAALPLLFGYCFLFSERKDAIRYAQLSSHWRRGRRGRVLELVPLWAINFVLAAVTAFLALLISAFELPGWHLWLGLAAGFAAVLLFALRDIALVLWCNLGGSQKRADGAALAYLFVLYGVLPALLGALGLSGWLGLLQPWSAFALPVWTLAAAAWAAAGLDLLRRRWLENVEALE